MDHSHALQVLEYIGSMDQAHVGSASHFSEIESEFGGLLKKEMKRFQNRGVKTDIFMILFLLAIFSVKG